MDNAKKGASKIGKIGKFAYFRVFRVKLSCREVQQKRFFHQNGVKGFSEGGSRR